MEHRLARLVQLGIRQARYMGSTKTLFQLYLAAAVANLTLLAGMAILKDTGPLPSHPTSTLLTLLAMLAFVMTATSVVETRPLPLSLTGSSLLGQAPRFQ